MYIFGRGKLKKSLFGVIIIILICFSSSLLFAQDKSPDLKGNTSKKSLESIKEAEKSLVIPEENIPVKNSEKKNANVRLISTWDFVKMFLVLGGVVAVIYFIFFLLKRGAKKRFVENDLIRIVGSKNLSGGKALHVIKIGGSFFVIGVAENGINLVSEITDKETIDDLNLRLSEMESVKKANFQTTFSDIFKVGKKRDTVSESLNFMKKQRERLNRLKE